MNNHTTISIKDVQHTLSTLFQCFNNSATTTTPPDEGIFHISHTSSSTNITHNLILQHKNNCVPQIYNEHRIPLLITNSPNARQVIASSLFTICHPTSIFGQESTNTVTIYPLHSDDPLNLLHSIVFSIDFNQSMKKFKWIYNNSDLCHWYTTKVNFKEQCDYLYDLFNFYHLSLDEQLMCERNNISEQLEMLLNYNYQHLNATSDHQILQCVADSLGVHILIYTQSTYNDCDTFVIDETCVINPIVPSITNRSCICIYRTPLDQHTQRYTYYPVLPIFSLMTLSSLLSINITHYNNRAVPISYLSKNNFGSHVFFANVCCCCDSNICCVGSICIISNQYSQTQTFHIHFIQQNSTIGLINNRNNIIATTNINEQTTLCISNAINECLNKIYNTVFTLVNNQNSLHLFINELIKRQQSNQFNIGSSFNVDYLLSYDLFEEARYTQQLIQENQPFVEARELSKIITSSSKYMHNNTQTSTTSSCTLLLDEHQINELKELMLKIRQKRNSPKNQSEKAKIRLENALDSYHIFLQLKINSISFNQLYVNNELARSLICPNTEEVLEILSKISVDTFLSQPLIKIKPTESKDIDSVPILVLTACHIEQLLTNQIRLDNYIIDAYISLLNGFLTMNTIDTKKRCYILPIEIVTNILDFMRRYTTYKKANETKKKNEIEKKLWKIANFIKQKFGGDFNNVHLFMVVSINDYHWVAAEINANNLFIYESYKTDATLNNQRLTIINEFLTPFFKNFVNDKIKRRNAKTILEQKDKSSCGAYSLFAIRYRIIQVIEKKPPKLPTKFSDIFNVYIQTMDTNDDDNNEDVFCQEQEEKEDLQNEKRRKRQKQPDFTIDSLVRFQLFCDFIWPYPLMH